MFHDIFGRVDSHCWLRHLRHPQLQVGVRCVLCGRKATRLDRTLIVVAKPVTNNKNKVVAERTRNQCTNYRRESPSGANGLQRSSDPDCKHKVNACHFQVLKNSPTFCFPVPTETISCATITYCLDTGGPYNN